MNNNNNISLRQLCVILITIIPSTSLLFLSASIYKSTKQDYWISILLIGIVMILYSMIFTNLVKLFPDKNFIEMCAQTIGKIPSKIIGILYLLFFMHTTSSILSEFNYFLNETLYHNTPLYFFAIGILIPCIFLVYKDIEVIGRIGEFLFLIFIITISIIILLSLTTTDFNRLLPFFSQSPVSIIKGSSGLTIWAGQLFLLLMISCKIKDKTSITKSIIFTIISIISIILVISTTVITTFGPNTEYLNFPFLSLARYVGKENVLQRLDTIFLLIWISSIFLKLSVYIYCGTEIVSSVYKIKNKLIYIILFSISIFILSQTLWEDSISFKSQLIPESPYYAIIQVFIPIIIFIIAVIKNKFNSKKAN